MQNYAIGTPGKPWGTKEKELWLAAQVVQRSYHDEVVQQLMGIVPTGFKVVQYGSLPYDEERYPLYAIVPECFDSAKPSALVTGGVHGYETSGVQGALKFIRNNLLNYAKDINLVVVPCVSPWGYETINRWNPLAIDPNRSFYTDSPASESSQLMAFIASLEQTFTLHIDLHETTDTDNSEFRPALAARFYTVANTTNPQLDFQKAVIDAVKVVTHIAPADSDGKIIGAQVVSEGVICYDKKSLYLCGGMTDAMYVTTTEVYPDSKQATPENCNDAQVAAVCASLNFIK